MLDSWKWNEVHYHPFSTQAFVKILFLWLPFILWHDGGSKRKTIHTFCRSKLLKLDLALCKIGTVMSILSCFLLKCDLMFVAALRKKFSVAKTLPLNSSFFLGVVFDATWLSAQVYSGAPECTWKGPSSTPFVWFLQQTATVIETSSKSGIVVVASRARFQFLVGWLERWWWGLV